MAISLVADESGSQFMTAVPADAIDYQFRLCRFVKPNALFRSLNSNKSPSKLSLAIRSDSFKHCSNQSQSSQLRETIRDSRAAIAKATAIHQHRKL